MAKPDWRRSRFWTIPVTVVGLMLVPVVPLIMMLATPFHGSRRVFYTLSPLWTRFIFWLCKVDFRVTGWDALPEDIRAQKQPAIFMSTHESNLDPAILIRAIPIPVVYMMKKELKWLHPVGWASMMAGFLFIDRAHSKRALESMRAAAGRIRCGKSVILFPEGTRTRTGRMLPFKKGGFTLAREAGVPIVPLATVGGFRMMPAGTVVIRPGNCLVAFGAPVYPRDYPTREAFMEEVRTRMHALWEDAQAPALRT